MDVLVANLMFHMYVCEPPTTNVTMQCGIKNVSTPVCNEKKKKKRCASRRCSFLMSCCSCVVRRFACVCSHVLGFNIYHAYQNICVHVMLRNRGQGFVCLS